MNVYGVTWGDQVWTVQAHVILQVLRNLELCRAYAVSLGRLTGVLCALCTSLTATLYIVYSSLLRLVETWCSVICLVLALVPAGCGPRTALLAFVGTLPTQRLLASHD